MSGHQQGGSRLPDDGLDVLAIGNAIVDRIAFVEDAVIESAGVPKGSMQLLDSSAVATVSAAANPGQTSAGGSAGNTAAAIADLGSKAGFVGRVGDDDLGRSYVEDMRRLGVWFEPSLAPAESAPTGCSLVLVTPDGERTMMTTLGAAGDIEQKDLPLDALRASKVLYVEGYLWDSALGHAGLELAMREARGAGARVALSLSDAFCVERHAEEFKEVLPLVDVLFGNESEVSILRPGDTAEEAAASLSSGSRTVAVTCGARGSVISSGGSLVRVEAAEVKEVVDTTGAGDLYAAGFLHGLVRGGDLELCGRLGSVVAGEIVSHLGARPTTSLARLVEAAGLRVEDRGAARADGTPGVPHQGR